MKIEAVVVCVDYSDFLAETLPGILGTVDSLIVVTSPVDAATKRLCRDRTVRVVETDEFYAGGSKFSLARGINAGLKACKLDDWVLIIDSDIALPPHTRQAIDFLVDAGGLEPTKLYGIDRVRAYGRTAWHAVRGQRQYQSPRIVAPALRLEDRLAIPAFGGYCPAGFWHLWNPRHSGICDYAVAHQGTAEQSDMEQATRWQRADRVFLPEIIGIHLETSTTVGENWSGRKTPRF